MKSASRDAYDPIETASIDELRALQRERLRYVTAWDYELIETEQTPTAATGANL